MDGNTGPRIRIMHARRMEIALYEMGGVTSVHPRQNAKGGLTFAYIDQGDTLKVAVARCRIDEHYCRKLGAHMARRKLDGEQWVVVDKPANVVHALHTLIQTQSHLRKNLRPSMKR